MHKKLLMSVLMMSTVTISKKVEAMHNALRPRYEDVLNKTFLEENNYGENERVTFSTVKGSAIISIVEIQGFYTKNFSLDRGRLALAAKQWAAELESAKARMYPNNEKIQKIYQLWSYENLGHPEYLGEFEILI